MRTEVPSILDAPDERKPAIDGLRAPGDPVLEDGHRPGCPHHWQRAADSDVAVVYVLKVRSSNKEAASPSAGTPLLFLGS